MGDLVGDRAVLEHALVAGGAEVPEPALEEEVDGAADRDDRHGQHREAPRGDVVLEREHSARGHVEELDRARVKRSPASAPPSIANTRRPSAAPPRPWRGRAHVGQRAPAPRARVEQLDLGDRGAARLELARRRTPRCARRSAAPRRSRRARCAAAAAAPRRAAAGRSARRRVKLRGVAPGQHVEAPAAWPRRWCGCAPGRGSSARAASGAARSRRSRASAASRESFAPPAA